MVAYHAAEAGHATEREALEAARVAFIEQQAEMLDEIEWLEHAYETATPRADRETEASCRQALAESQAGEQAAQAQVKTLVGQLYAVRLERREAVAQMEGWMERAMAAEAKLAAAIHAD